MSREALYRRYRPHRFRDVVGQDAEVRLLADAVRRGMVSHAYLLAGPRGTGKTSVARILAQAVLCEAPEDGEPCGVCGACRAVENRQHLDLVEIDGASNRGIDEVRDLREMVLHAPSMGRRKVYIVDEVHMLTEPAFNAFLKTLEEPPPHVVFVFATTEPHKVPITVLSRCQRYDFRRIDDTVIVRQLARILEQEGVPGDAEALARIAEASEGGLRDAESLLDQVLAGGPVTVARVEAVLGALDQGQLRRLIEALVGGDLSAVLGVVDDLYAAGRDPRQMLRDVARRLRDRWAASLTGQAGTAAPSGDWFEALEALAEAETRLRGTFPPRLVIELGLLKAARALAGAGAPPLAAVAAPPAAATPEPVSPHQAAETPEPVSPHQAAEAMPPVAPPADPEPPRRSRGAAAAAPREGAPRLEAVVERLRRRRQLTAALFRHAALEDAGDEILVRFRYPAHYAILDDEQSGHRQAFLECFRELYGERPVRFGLEADGADGGEAGRPEITARIREVFGPDVPLVVAEDADGGR